MGNLMMEVGYSVQYDSAEEIVDRVKDILDSYETISKELYRKVDRFDWDKIAKEYFGVYLECSKRIDLL